MASATIDIDSLVQTSGQDSITFTKSSQAQAADYFDGGDSNDTIQISGPNGVNINLGVIGVSGSAGFHDYETLSFDNATGTSTVKLNAAQFGTGLIAQGLDVQGSTGVQEIVILGAQDFSARKWTFTNWTSGTDLLTIFGTAGADRLTGSDLGSTLEGGDGNDVLTGGAGADILRGGNGDDVLVGGGGLDALYGGAGFDTLSYSGAVTKVTVSLAASTARLGSASAGTFLSFENIIGSAFDDELYGDASSNNVSGGDGDDFVSGGGGADKLSGGSGTDTLSYAGSLEAISLDLDTKEFRFGDAAGDVIAGFEIFIGSSFGDWLSGDSDKNTLIGGDGDDKLTGGHGGDDLRGGAGVDEVSYELSAAAVQIDLSRLKFKGGDATGDVIDKVEDITGSAFGDVLTGNGGGNSLTGGAGNDKINGKDGADTLNGGDGIDMLSYAGSSAGVTINLGGRTASGGDATGDIISKFEDLSGSRFKDALKGDELANRIAGGGGNDWIDGDLGDDVLIGGAGDDVIIAGKGNDILSGGKGNDTLFFDQVAWVAVNLSKGTAVTAGGVFTDKFTGFENLRGSEIYDDLIGDSYNNIIDGRNGNDDIWSKGGNDVIFGRNGKEFIKAGGGNDTIYGGLEDDDMWGGKGRDSFAFASMKDSGTTKGMVDLIYDFQAGVDHIDLSKLDASAKKAGNQAFEHVGGSNFTAEGQIRVSQYGSYTIIELNTTGSSGRDMVIALVNFTATDLSQGDFIF